MRRLKRRWFKWLVVKNRGGDPIFYFIRGYPVNPNYVISCCYGTDSLVPLTPYFVIRGYPVNPNYVLFKYIEWNVFLYIIPRAEMTGVMIID